MKLIVAEKRARSQIKLSPSPEAKNLIHKAFGVLTYAYQLEIIESFDLLSACKLGIDLGWITGVDHKAINKLLINCRKAHLSEIIKSELNNEEAKTQRALLIKKSLKKAKLQNL